MNKTNIILICIIISLVSGIAGYIIGVKITKIAPNVASNSTTIKEPTAIEKCVGTYYSSTWNGRNATLVLNEDMTMKYPTGSTGTWSLDGDKIHLYLDGKDVKEMLKSFGINDVNELDSNKVDIPQTQNSGYIATIVNNGVMLNDNFFQKMN